MNKAFLREPDSSDEFCPRCGAAGQSVSRTIVAAHARDPAELQIADVANFCPTPSCPVAYFDVCERVVTVDALAHPIYPKDLAAPICVWAVDKLKPMIGLDDAFFGVYLTLRPRTVIGFPDRGPWSAR